MKLSNTYRSMVRFVCVGAFGTLLQYGIYYLFLNILHRAFGETQTMTSIAFSIGFVVEMVVNYFLTNFVTFRTRPNWKNAGGFLVGRVLNYGVQLLFLNILLWFALSEEVSGILAIVLAGVVNYFVLVPFFQTKSE